MFRKIISGGQTGADIAAIDAAMLRDFEWGGIVPKGFVNENGVIDSVHYFRFEESNSSDYRTRTAQNITKSDATLLFCHGAPTGGSAFTRRVCWNREKNCLFVDFNVLTVGDVVPVILRFIDNNDVEVLNVAGSRHSKDKYIYDKVKSTMLKVIDGYRDK